MSRHRSLITALAALILVAPLNAQTIREQGESPAVTPSAVAVDQAPVSLAPTVAHVTIGVQANTGGALTAGPNTPATMRRSPAMMIVGGAALVVGAVIGGKAGTIVMVGGAVVGLIGLWNYLQ